MYPGSFPFAEVRRGEASAAGVDASVSSPFRFLAILFNSGGGPWDKQCGKQKKKQTNDSRLRNTGWNEGWIRARGERRTLRAWRVDSNVIVIVIIAKVPPEAQILSDGA
jgi:hypothetical protein